MENSIYLVTEPNTQLKDQDNLVSELSRQKQVYKFLELLLNSASYLNEGIITKKMNPFVR
ncbi:TPA: hypothetical protein ACG8YQ_002791 [Enterococcus faecium]